jgi:NADH:ubiquinone oxidoreductase subunit 3 (subunit A)
LEKNSGSCNAILRFKPSAAVVVVVVVVVVSFSFLLFVVEYIQTSRVELKEENLLRKYVEKETGETQLQLNRAKQATDPYLFFCILFITIRISTSCVTIQNLNPKRSALESLQLHILRTFAVEICCS